jgi:hypothetical protein
MWKTGVKDKQYTQRQTCLYIEREREHICNSRRGRGKENDSE